MFFHKSDPTSDQKQVRMARDTYTQWGRRVQGFVATVVAIAATASLVGCVSTSEVVAANTPGTYTVASSATGGRMAWARAHEHAINEARDYCERRGMQSSVAMETVSGVQAMTEHESSVNFECHPKF
jgi:hypothetical protein